MLLAAAREALSGSGAASSLEGYYSPLQDDPRMKPAPRIAFFAGNSIPVHAYSLDERPLGGTETGLIRVSGILAKRGYDVTVFSAHRAPPPSNPKFLHESQLYQAGNFDVFVAVQHWKPLFYRGVPAKRMMFWT